MVKLEGVILASASPRRKEILSKLYDNFKVIPSRIKEVVPKEMGIEQYPQYLADKKAETVAKAYKKWLVIGCDTAVIVDGNVLNKPRSTEDAREMMKMLSGKVHRVITGCCLFYMGKSYSFSESTEVEFYPLTDEEIENYVITPEPYDKAGGYAIQGMAALFIKGIKGDYYNIVGLPVARLQREIAAFLDQDFTLEPPPKKEEKKKKKKK